MAGETPENWAAEYISWPGNTLYPDDDTYPDYSSGVSSSATPVHGYAGSVWERVTDTSSIDAMLQATQNLTNAIKSIPTSLDRVVGVENGKVINATVVAQLFSRYVTAQEGEFVKLQAGQIAANAIGASHIQAGAIDGTVITGATIRTNSGNPRVEMTKEALSAYNSSGTQTFRVRADDGSVYIRGDLGLTDNWSTGKFQAISRGQQVYSYSNGGMYGWVRRLTPGMLFQATSPLRWPGVVTMADGWDPQRWIRSYELLLQAPTQNRSRPPILVHSETGLRYALNDSNDVSFRITPRGGAWASTTYSMSIVNNSNDGRGFYAYANNSVNESGYYSYFAANADNGLQSYKDTHYFHARGGDSSGILWNNYYNTTASGGNATAQFSVTPTNFMYASRSGANRHTRITIADGGYSTQFFANSSGVGLQIDNGGQFWINQSGQAQWYNTVKSFQMDVPEVTKQTGQTLVHIVTESPWNGIEYWETVTADENGEAEWLLPEYVSQIASEVTPRAVLATCSTGTAAATLEKVFGRFVVYVSEATPGARVSLLVKMGRIIPDMAYKDEDGYVNQWTDAVPQVWQPLPPSPYEYEAGRLTYSYNADDGGLGPVTQAHMKEMEAALVEEISPTTPEDLAPKPEALEVEEEVDDGQGYADTVF